MIPIYEFGAEVRVIRTIRNDGTFPGFATGQILVTAGSVGFVRNVGTFLQDQLIYTVHFVQEDKMVGCREEELIPVDADWVPTRFAFRDKVTTTVPLRSAGEIVADAGRQGEIVKVLRDFPGGPAYHLYLDGRTFQVPETVLVPV